MPGLHTGMEIPDNASVAFDSRLTVVRACLDLAEHGEAIKSQIKKDMAGGGAQYVQSRLALGKLVAWKKSAVDPVKLYELVKSKKITIEAFLSCVSVQKKPLRDHLGELEIDAISSPCGEAEPNCPAGVVSAHKLPFFIRGG